MTDASLPLLLYARRFRRIAELTMREIPRPVTRKTLPGPSKHRLSHWQSKGLIMRVRYNPRMVRGWEGEKVRLVPIDMDRHLDNAVTWMNDPNTSAHLLMGDFPITRLAEREYFEAHSKGSKEDVMFAMETLDGRHIGFCGIHRIDFRHGTAITGQVIGDPNEWGKGYGSDAAKVRARYAFEVLNLRLLLSEVFEDNERSLRTLEKVGYVEYGRCPKKYWVRGRYVDSILVALDRDRWLSLNP
ncbi:MAG: GNAT family N-acetyltransferase [Fimbriimonas ginsengisoli]|uniref:GNAT family N-acetyltransferase n=1 Tax=Fimbriimonas ginsengisoli TaxID=1005039 RepID=A0A931LZA2_FIMGI|nr:GNAT family N-acetyltransferase [Fimbriimonas ginsengisoli]